MRKDLKVARIFRNRLEVIPELKRMVVYGSRVGAFATPESDLDVFIEVSELNADIRQRIQEIAWEVSLESGMVISTFIASSDSLEHSMLAAHPLLKTIEMEGVVI